jgi:hypothetical protein
VDLTTAAEEVHNGYFSIDKKKVGSKTVEVFKDTKGTTAGRRRHLQPDHAGQGEAAELRHAAEVHLLAFRAARRLGQPERLSDLRIAGDGFRAAARQTIGRGLRLCVNQNGERLRGFEINTLTVIATESYEQFAEKLQKEIEDETGIRFGIVEAHQFAGVTATGADGQPAPLGFDQSKALWEHLKTAGLVNAQGKVQDALRKALKDGTLTLPEPFAAQLPQVKEILRKLAGRLEIKNADERKQVKSRQAVLQGADFKALWERIKHKTTYRVQFDNEALLVTCIKALADAPPIAKTRLQWRKADLAIGRSGVDTKETVTSAPVTSTKATSNCPISSPTFRTRPSSPVAASTASSWTAAGSMTSSATRSSSSNLPPRSSTAPSAWPSWTASSTSALATSVLRPGTLRDRGAIRLSQVDDRRQQVRPRAGDLPIRHRADLCRRPGEERGDQGVRQAPWLVQSPDTVWAPTTRTGPCWWRRTAPSVFTLSSKPRAASSPMTCGTRKARRSLDVARQHFKAPAGQRDDLRPERLAREVVALANFQGGRVLIGVEDDGRISGIQRKDLERWVMDAVFGRLVHPQLLPYYEEVPLDEGRRVAVVTVLAGTAKPYVVRFRQREDIYVRVGSTSQLASRERQAALFASGGLLHAELLPVSGSAIADLDPARLTDYLGRVLSDAVPADEAAWWERLCGLGFMAERAGGPPVCTIAGLVLFAYRPPPFVAAGGSALEGIRGR